MAVEFDGGVVIGADSRTTSGLVLMIEQPCFNYLKTHALKIIMFCDYRAKKCNENTHPIRQ